MRKDIFHDNSCERCKTMIEPNRCMPCDFCDKQIHIDRGMLAWPIGGGYACSDCYEQMKADVQR